MSAAEPIRNSQKLQDFKNYYLSEKCNARNYTLFVMGLNTALRISDLLQLQWKDVYDFSRETCFSHVCVTEQKTGKTNQIALNQAIIDALGNYYGILKEAPSGEHFLFPSRKGNNRPLGRSQAFRIVKEAARANGMNQHISCHSLRKTFGYHAWRQGVSSVLLTDIYNHSSFRITKRYLGIEQDDRDNIFLNISL